MCLRLAGLEWALRGFHLFPSFEHFFELPGLSHALQVS